MYEYNLKKKYNLIDTTKVNVKSWPLYSSYYNPKVAEKTLQGII